MENYECNNENYCLRGFCIVDNQKIVSNNQKFSWQQWKILLSECSQETVLNKSWQQWIKFENDAQQWN